MSATVTLEVIKGSSRKKRFEFFERVHTIAGRGSDCVIRVGDEHNSVSRHHCAIEVSPPYISVRDLGSLNGTYINQKCIGRRDKGESPVARRQSASPNTNLSHRDELQLGEQGEFKLRVLLFAPAHCTHCNVEVAGVNRFETTKGSTLMCAQCQEKTVRAPVRPIHAITHCPVCGDEVPVPEGRSANEKIVCSKCSADTAAMLRHLAAQEDVRAGLSAIQDHELLQKIGTGGFGAVFLALHRQTHRQVALKVMLPNIAADAEARQRFEREIENTKALNHPNVVRLYEEGRTQGLYYFTMGYCEGGNISDLVARRGCALSVDEAMPLIFQVLEGLNYAHHAPIPRVRLADGSYGPGVGLVHRDIKPCNLLLEGHGKSRVVKVSDYGMAKAFEKAGQTGITRPGMVAGSFHFMPRQQILGFGESLPEVDVWAAAASLYYMLTGLPPRDFPPGADLTAVVLQHSPVPIRKRKPTLPKRLAKVIDDALVDSPSIGIKDIKTFQKRLKGAL